MEIQDNPARVSIFLVSLLLLLVITPLISISITSAQNITVANTDQTTSGTVITKDDAKTDTTNTITQTKTFFNQLSQAAKTAGEIYPEVRSGTYTTRPAPEQKPEVSTEYNVRYGEEPAVYSQKIAETIPYSITQPPSIPFGKPTGQVTGAYQVTQPPQLPSVKMAPLVMPTVTPLTPIQPPPISGGLLGLGGGTEQIPSDVTGYITDGTGFINDAIKMVFAHREILYMMAILIISAVFAQIGGWRIGVIGLMGMLLVCAGITLSTGTMIIPSYVIFVIVIIAVSLVILAFTRVTGGGEG